MSDKISLEEQIAQLDSRITLIEQDGPIPTLGRLLRDPQSIHNPQLLKALDDLQTALASCEPSALFLYSENSLRQKLNRELKGIRTLVPLKTRPQLNEFIAILKKRVDPIISTEILANLEVLIINLRTLRAGLDANIPTTLSLGRNIEDLMILHDQIQVLHLLNVEGPAAALPLLLKRLVQVKDENVREMLRALLAALLQATQSPFSYADYLRMLQVRRILMSESQDES